MNLINEQLLGDRNANRLEMAGWVVQRARPWRGDGMEIWLNNAVVATALVVALSNVFMARVLFQFYHHRADHFRAPRFWCCSPAS